MCMTRLSELPLDKQVTVEADEGVPIIKDLVTDVSWNFRIKKKINSSAATARAPDATWRMQQRTSIVCRNFGNARMFFFAGRLPRGP